MKKENIKLIPLKIITVNNLLIPVYLTNIFFSFVHVYVHMCVGIYMCINLGHTFHTKHVTK